MYVNKDLLTKDTVEVSLKEVYKEVLTQLLADYHKTFDRSIEQHLDECELSIHDIEEYLSVVDHPVKYYEIPYALTSKLESLFLDYYLHDFTILEQVDSGNYSDGNTMKQLLKCTFTDGKYKGKHAYILRHGTYSSWDRSEFYGIYPVKLKLVEVAEVEKSDIYE